MRILDRGFWIWGLEVGVQYLEFRDCGLGFRVWGLEFGIESLGFGV